MADCRVNKLRILIVEDDDNIRGLMRELLYLYHHEVYQAGDGENGLKLLQSQPFDLLITDLGLPGISGWDLVDAARRCQAELRVVAITSWRGEDVDERIKSSGIDRCIWKPFRFEDLLLTLSGMFPTSSPLHL
jgi:DNA-binding response OmpR family regulator